MLTATLNFPSDAKIIQSLVVDENDLTLIMPKAKLPFDAAQWNEILDESLSFLVLQDELFMNVQRM